MVVDVKQRVVHKTLYTLTFKLTARAHVRLVAKLHKHVVAETAAQNLAPGRHRLRLRLNPKRWPNDLDFQVHAAHGAKS